MIIKNRDGEIIFKGVDVRGANLRYTDLHGVDLHGADLRGADLHGADLRGADLSGADLHGADLRGADLRGADLRGADLSGANLSGAIIQINGSCHQFIYVESCHQIQIGCLIYPVEYWIKNYKTIGKENNYSNEQIEEYFKYYKCIINLKEI